LYSIIEDASAKKAVQGLLQAKGEGKAYSAFSFCLAIEKVDSGRSEKND